MEMSVNIKLIMALLVCLNIFVPIIDCDSTERNKDEKVLKSSVQSKENKTEKPPSANIKFFDLSSAVNRLFPNLNRGQPNWNQGNNFPQNGPYYPGGGYQGNYPQGNFPPYQGPQNQGNYPPYPNGGPQNQGFNPQGPFNNPNEFRPQYPNQGPNYYPGPQNPNNGMSNWRPEFNGAGPNRYPNQGPNGLYTNVQVPPNLGGNWNQPQPVYDPDSGRPLQYPYQGNRRPPFDGSNNFVYPGNNVFKDKE